MKKGEKSDDSGIQSLGGFAYQILVFVYYLSTIDDGSQVEFETLEDVTINNSNLSDSIDKNSDVFKSLVKKENGYSAIQVKRTKVTDSKKILYNWLLLESRNSNITEYILFTDEKYGNKGDLFGHTSKKLFDIIKKSNKKSTALITKVKVAYNGDFKLFESAYKSIQQKYEFKSEDNLDEKIINGFSEIFHRGGVGKFIYNLRVDEFIKNITADTLDSINKNKPYICTHQNLMQKSEDICNRIQEDKMDFNFSLFKKINKINLSDEKIANSREYKQLYACKLEEIRIERHLLFQEYYKSFKYRSLENNKLNIIESLEEATYDNFCDAKDFLKETNVDSPKTRLIKTKEKDNSYTNQNEIKFGSCIYLTRDIETQELIISWEDEL